LRYRRQSRPLLMKAICEHAHQATVHVLRNTRAVRRFVSDVARSTK
jgi:hypothetical protein